MIHPDRIRALRALYVDWKRALAAIDPDDGQAFMLGAMLIEVVPDLLDEIEQLQAEREEGGRPRIRTFCKPDRMGGRA